MKSQVAPYLIVVFTFLFVSCETEFVENFCPGLVNCVGDDGSSIVYTTLFSDNFNRADQSPIGSPWNFIIQGTDLIDLKNNEVSPQETDASNPPGALHTTNVTATNVRVSISARITGAGYAGEMLVYMRSQNNGDILNTYFCGVDPNNNRLTIAKRNAGTASPLANSTGTMTYNSGDSYVLTFTGEGTSLSCTLSGSDSLSVSATDSDFSTGYAGMAAGQNGNNLLLFDDFVVQTGN